MGGSRNRIWKIAFLWGHGLVIPSIQEEFSFFSDPKNLEPTVTTRGEKFWPVTSWVMSCGKELRKPHKYHVDEGSTSSL
jgi:hypothetical protein